METAFNRRRIYARRDNLKTAVKKGESTSSLVRHIENTGYIITLKVTKTITEFKYLIRWLVREALDIEKSEWSQQDRRHQVIVSSMENHFTKENY